MVDLIPLSELPESFRYPREFVRTVELGLVELEPWLLLTGDLAYRLHRELADRYPGAGYVPFASRQDNDDVVCWIAGPEVVTVHNRASAGWERRGPVYPNFHSWLRSAIEEYIFWGDLESGQES
jgi:hypothetical protein